MTPRNSYRYDRAVTRKIIKRSIAKNKAIKEALEMETEINRAKWQQILSELAYMEPESEREKRAHEIFLAWTLTESPKAQRLKKIAPKKPNK